MDLLDWALARAGGATTLGWRLQNHRQRSLGEELRGSGGFPLAGATASGNETADTRMQGSVRDQTALRTFPTIIFRRGRQALPCASGLLRHPCAGIPAYECWPQALPRQVCKPAPCIFCWHHITATLAFPGRVVWQPLHPVTNGPPVGDDSLRSL